VTDEREARAMYEVDFLPVGDGNGDAICVRYGNDQTGYWLHVIDGGFTDTSDTIIKHIETHYGSHYKITHMVLSHADNDHACGLIGVLKRFEIAGAIWMNRPWLYAQQVLSAYPGYTLDRLVREMRDKHSYLVEIEKIAQSRGTKINEVFQGADIGPFKVLAPHPQRYIGTIPNFEKTPEAKRPFVSAAKTFLGEAVEAVAKWANEEWHIETLSNDPDPPTSDHNESSLVQLGTFEGQTVLLTGDVGPVGLTRLPATRILSDCWHRRTSSRCHTMAAAGTSLRPCSIDGSVRSRRKTRGWVLPLYLWARPRTTIHAAKFRTPSTAAVTLYMQRGSRRRRTSMVASFATAGLAQRPSLGPAGSSCDAAAERLRLL
jgi:hypothetical protein